MTKERKKKKKMSINLQFSKIGNKCKLFCNNGGHYPEHSSKTQKIHKKCYNLKKLF